MKNLFLSASALLLVCAAMPAHADTAIYTITVNTHSEAAQQGYIDLEFNNGGYGTVPDITASVTGFSGAVLAGSPSTFGPTTGSLDDGNLVLDNQSFNDYFEGLTFGDQLSFVVTLSGIDAGESGTNFDVSFADSTGLNYLFTSDPYGVAGQIAIAGDGSVQVVAQDGTTITPAVAATPEPATLSLLALGGVAVGFARKWRTRVA